jgi:hypothetical protein
VFNNGDDEEGWVIFEGDPLDGIGIAIFEEEGEKAFTDIFDIVGGDGIEDGERKETEEKIDKEAVIVKDEFKAVVFWFMDSHEIPPENIRHGDAECFSWKRKKGGKPGRYPQHPIIWGKVLMSHDICHLPLISFF